MNRFGKCAAAALPALLAAGCASTTGSADLGLEGTTWRVQAVHDGRSAVVAMPAGIVPTLSFDTAGARVSGSAGCNQYDTSVVRDGVALRFGPIATSKRMCVEPEGVMGVERGLLTALARVARARIDEGRLELLGDDGAVVVVLAAGAAR